MNEPGRIGWVDLTVPDAQGVRDFYKAVVGWTVSEVPMGDYSDFCVHPSESEPPVAGICHARGSNAAVPPQWLIYITVTNLDASLASCLENGGKILAEPRKLGGAARFAVIKDPTGAVAALYESGAEQPILLA